LREVWHRCYGFSMTKTSTPVRTTVEARIWAVSDHGSADRPHYRVKVYTGMRGNVDWLSTRIPLSDVDQTTWFTLTLEDGVIVGITV
jgi:hypothetical protein